MANRQHVGASSLRSPLREFLLQTCLLGLLLEAGTAEAQLGNLQFTQDEVFTPIAYFDRDNMPCGESLCAEAPNGPTGSNTALVLKGYLIVMGSFDSGVAEGPLHVFDVSDPKQPRRITTMWNDATREHRELHAMPVAVVDGRYYVAITARPQGVKFWDFTDPESPTLAGEVALSDRGGDYDNAAWQMSWTWPYLFVSGTGDGVYVVDTTNPAEPTFLTRIPTSELGGQRVGPLHAIGNRLVVTNMDQTPMRITVVDVTDPNNAFQLASGTSPETQYSALVVGDRLFSLGDAGNYTFWSWSDDEVQVTSRRTFGADKGGYCTYQDTFIFCGQSSEGVRKIDVSDMADPRDVGIGDLDRPNADTDFATVLGNMVYLGNDHGTGSALLPHQAEPDTTPPALLQTFPQDGATNLPTNSRLTVFLTDVPEMETVNQQSFVVRDGITCAPVDGVRTYSSFNAISFGARAPFASDTTYEIVIPADGLKDIAGNAIAEDSIIRFSTGASLAPETCTGGDAGTGGAGGTSGAGGVGTGGASGSGGSSGGSEGGSSGTSMGGSEAGGSGSGMGGSGAGGLGGSLQGGTAGVPIAVGGSVGQAVGGGSSSAGPSDSEAGCACSAPGKRDSGLTWLALPALGFAASLRRRRQWRTRRRYCKH